MKTALSPLALCERGFSLYADRPAVIDGDRSFTYRQLQDRVQRLAGGLAAQGVRPGDRVALLAPNVGRAFECYTGVPLAGAVLVPLNTRLTAEDFAYIVRHSGARLLLADPETLHAAPSGVDVIPLGPEYEAMLASAEPVPFAADAVDEDAVVTLNYTSGTTARPKGVMQTHRNTFLNAVDMLLALGFRREDVHLHVAPMFHANGWGCVWATLAAGAANVMLRRVDGPSVFGQMRRHGVTTMCAAATVLTRLLAEAGPGDGRHPVRVAVAGMAPPAEVIRRVEHELGWDIRHLYGLTETTAFITYCEEPAELRRADGRQRADFKARQGIPLPLAGRVRVVRPDLSDVARDGQEMGEIVARGNVIMAGYYRDEAATAQAMAGGWFHTGDLGVWHPDGYIEIKDRAKDMIISGGENIPSLEVEGVLYRHPDIAQAAVVAAEHAVWGETPVAFVVPRAAARPAEAEVVAFCRARLPHFKVPSRVILTDDLPRTASGKIQKGVLRARLRAEGGPATEAAASPSAARQPQE